MKKTLIISIAFLIIGLAVGLFVGSLVVKNKMQEEVHDTAVIELNKMTIALQDAAAEFYASTAYNVYGEYFPDWAIKNGSERVIWFVAEFLDNNSWRRRIDGTAFTVESEKRIRSGKSIPMPSNKEFIHSEIKLNAQHIAKKHAEQYKKSQ